jgi:hypothetical protein
MARCNFIKDNVMHDVIFESYVRDGIKLAKLYKILGIFHDMDIKTLHECIALTLVVVNVANLLCGLTCFGHIYEF